MSTLRRSILYRSAALSCALMGSLVPGGGGVHGEGDSGRAAYPPGVVPMNSASLLQAVRKGDHDSVVLLLRLGVNPNVTDESGRTPMVIARENGRPDLVKALAKASTNRETDPAKLQTVRGPVVKDRQASMGQNSLLLDIDPGVLAPKRMHVIPRVPDIAAEAGVRILELDRGRLPDGFAEGGADFLAKRELAGGREAMEFSRASDLLIERGLRAREAKLNRQFRMPGSGIDSSGEFALPLEPLGGLGGLLPEHLETGPSPDPATPGGWEPLHLALERGDSNAVRDLLRYGADPNAEGPLGLTAMDLALAWDTPAEEFEALLLAGADPNRNGPDGRLPLDAALSRGNFSQAKILLEHEAHAGGALTNAVLEGNAAAFSFLMGNGADPNDSAADPPLVAAVRTGSVAMVAELLKAGATTTRRGREGQPALHLAVALNRVDLANLLLEAGADPNAPFKEPVSKAFLAMVREVGYIKWQFRRDSRITLLMMAADSGNHTLARLLLAHGARKNVWTRRRSYYPIGFAARRGDVKMMQILLGVDPDKEERWIKVDLSQQMAWVYDRKGKTLLSTRVSSGRKGYRTRTGEFVITNKKRHHVSNIYEGAKMPYFQRLSCGDFGFHEGYCPGYAASHGCIRIPPGNARRFWQITKPGDRVVIRP